MFFAISSLTATIQLITPPTNPPTHFWEGANKREGEGAKRQPLSPLLNEPPPRSHPTNSPVFKMLDWQVYKDSHNLPEWLEEEDLSVGSRTYLFVGVVA